MREGEGEYPWYQVAFELENKGSVSRVCLATAGVAPTHNSGATSLSSSRVILIVCWLGRIT